MYEAIAFYIFAAITIGFFLVAVFSKNALFSMSALAGGMVFIAGFFFLLDAEFLGVVQIIVYTSAIMAIYAFGMMFFDTTKDMKEKIKSKKIIYTLSLSISILILLMLSIPLLSQQKDITGLEVQSTSLVNMEKQDVGSLQINSALSNTHAVGKVLFTKYLVVFELTAIMLLVAMIAGIVLVSKRMDEQEAKI